MYSEAFSVSNVSCVVDNFTNMVCSWEIVPPPGSLPNMELDVSLNWTSSDGHTNQACPIQSASDCRWPSYNFTMGSVYMMMVSVLTLDRWGKVLQSDHTKQLSIDTFAIVKIPPVQDLRIESINSSCVQLTWQQTQHHAVGNTTCRVQYNCTELNQNCQTHETDESDSTCICGLSAQTQYEWRVSCRTHDSLMWSQPVGLLQTTPSDSPYAGPVVRPGSYMELSCSQPNCRRVRVYWQNLPSHLSNGDMEKYQIVATDLATGHWDTIQHSFSNETSATVALRKDRSYSIRINFCTSTACQDFSNPIVVPSRGNGVPGPEGFMVEFVSDGKPPYLNLTWRPLPAAVPLISYTIFWCKGTTNNCRSPVNWFVISRESNQHELALPGLTPDTFRKYQVGVSAEAELKGTEERARRSIGLVASSGITWSPCLYGKSTVPSFVIENVHQSQSLTSDSVDVAWDPPTCQQTASAPTGVLLIYCMASGTKCTGPKMEKRVGGMMSTASLIGLQTGETYLLTVRAMTHAGVGPPSQPVTLAVKQDLTLLIAVLLSFGILLLLLLITFFIVWGVRRMCTSGSEEISLPGEEKLLPEKQGFPPPPPLNPPPEGRSSYRNNSYRQRTEDKQADSDQLLKPDFYKETPSQRSSAPVKVDNCYMVPPSTKPNSRHSKRHSNNNNKPPIVAALEAKSDDSFPLLDFTDEGIPRERLSSFKGHLTAKDYGFAVKGQIDYEDLLNVQLERENAKSQESFSVQNRYEKQQNYKSFENQKSHKKTQSVSFRDDEKFIHDSTDNSHSPLKSMAIAGQSSPGIEQNKERPSKKERRWSKGRLESDGHKYSDTGHKRLSKDSDFPTPPPTPPLYLKKEINPENRFSGQDFPAPPPPPPTYHDRQQTPEIRFSGQFSFPTPPPPPLEPEDEFRNFDSTYPFEGQDSLPSPKQNVESVKKFPPSPNEMYPPEPPTAVLSSKHRPRTKQELPQRFPPAPNEMNSQFNYPLQHGFIPAPKERKIELYQDPQAVYSPPPREDKKNQIETQIPSPKQRTKEIKSSQPTVVEPRSPISPDRLSKTLSEADPDSTLDISFLLGDVLGGGMTVRTTENNTNEVQMRPKPRQNIPIEHSKHQPSNIEAIRMDSHSNDQENAEVVMRKKPPATSSTLQRDVKTKSDPAERDSKLKSNPPTVAPKPVFIKAKDSVYGRLESSLAEQELAPRSSTSQNPDYVHNT